MARVSDTLGSEGFPLGVLRASDPTLLPSSASPRGLNSALALASAGTPFVQKRNGLRTINATPITGSAPIIGQYNYRQVASGTDYHLLLDTLGNLTNRDEDDVLTTVSTAFTAGEYYPDWATSNDLCFIANGVDRLKFDGTTVSNFGVERPTVGTMAGAGGTSGAHHGTYELRVTYGVSATGAESSASDTAATTVTVNNKAIDWTNVPVSADPQVDRRYLYVRNTATQVNFYRVGTIANNTATTASTSVADANATIAAPTTSGRDRPPSGIKYLCVHQGRLFAADDSYLYWSELDAPEAFNSLSLARVNAVDGQRITGLISDQETLLIFKEGSVHGLFNGNNPLTWQIRLIDGDYGCVSHRTLLSADKFVYWFSASGLCRTDGSGVDPVGTRLYGPLDNVNVLELRRASGARDATQRRILMAVPGTSQERATLIIPFHTGANAFEADYWDPMDAASLGTAVDSDGYPAMWLGNYGGQLFRMWDTNADGVNTGTVKGLWTASGTSATTFSSLQYYDSTGALVPAALDTTGAGLIERKVTLVDADGHAIGSVRRRIVSNTATSFTLDVEVGGFTAGATYTFLIGGPDFQWDTPWLTYMEPWTKKRYEHFYLLVKGLNYGSSAAVDLAFDYDNANANAKERSFVSSNVSGAWDGAVWDQDVWDVGANAQQRFRVGRVGFAWRARIRNGEPNQPMALLKIAMDGVLQTRKR